MYQRSSPLSIPPLEGIVNSISSITTDPQQGWIRRAKRNSKVSTRCEWHSNEEYWSNVYPIPRRDEIKLYSIYLTPFSAISLPKTVRYNNLLIVIIGGLVELLITPFQRNTYWSSNPKYTSDNFF